MMSLLVFSSTFHRDFGHGLKQLVTILISASWVWPNWSHHRPREFGLVQHSL